jgi:hypothetical protein
MQASSVLVLVTCLLWLQQQVLVLQHCSSW